MSDPPPIASGSTAKPAQSAAHPADPATGAAPSNGAATAAPPPPPNPLDGLSQADLRKKLDASRKDLRGYLERKKKIDKELAMLEGSIYAFEGSYLSDQLLPPSANPANFGNIIKGYDAYLKPPTTTDRKRGRVGEEARDSDRMFSRSSATYQKALDLRNSEMLESASEEESMGSGGGRKKRKH